MVTTFKHYTEGFAGTGLVGYVETEYKDLVEVFGVPTFSDTSDDGKVTAEWCLKFIDGTLATIYDYKEYSTPRGVYKWHIGGRVSAAVDNVSDAMALRGKIVQTSKVNY